MNAIRKKIEKAMYSEEKSRFFSVEFFLLIASVFYGVIVRIRNALYGLRIFKQKRLQCKVISIGNIAVGGTGKTPMTICLAEKLTTLGYKVVVISRGYKGKFEKKGGIISNGKEMLTGPDFSGDEPFLMAAKLKNIPVVVGQNRYDAGLLAIKNFSPDVIILDDAFQHIKLFRDIDLLLLDSRRPFGNFHLIPRGILREPAASIKRADSLILTKSSIDDTEIPNEIKSISRGYQVFIAYNTYYYYKINKDDKIEWTASFNNESSNNYSSLAGKKAVVFSGIAWNEDFRKTVEDFKCNVLNFFGFPDHYRYSDNDMENIMLSVKNLGAEIVITTEKDYARMGEKFRFPVELIVVGVKLCLKDDHLFNSFIRSRLGNKNDHCV